MQNPLTRLERPPARGPAKHAQEVSPLLWQADGLDVRLVVHGHVQADHCHVEAVRLGRELEARVHLGSRAVI